MADPVYLFSVLRHYVTGLDHGCPHCLSHSTKVIGRKYLVLQLRKCDDCGLMFRFPKDSTVQNKKYYSGAYQEAGLTTDVPSAEALKKMLSTNFKDTGKDFAPRIDLLKKYKQTGSLLDFGASWGYGSWQIKTHGFDVTAFEIDANRAAFGEHHLKLRYFTDWDELIDSKLTFDVIFTSHVLEHLPEIQSIFSAFYSLLNPEGIIQIYVPNCTGMSDRTIFQQKKTFAFGQKHSIAFDVDFFTQNLPKYGFQVEHIGVGQNGYTSPTVQDLIEEPELVIIARKITEHA